jgi:hypothetical protein
MTRKKEYSRECEKTRKYQYIFNNLHQNIVYDRKFINKNLNKYYDKEMLKNERTSFKKRFSIYNSNVNYSRFLKKKIANLGKKFNY